MSEAVGTLHITDRVTEAQPPPYAQSSAQVLPPLDARGWMASPDGGPDTGGES